MSGTGAAELRISEDAVALAREAARCVAADVRAAVAARGGCTLALSGGSTPWAMLAHLVDEPDLPWGALVVFQVDERVAPDGDPVRNLTHLRAALPADVAVRAMGVTERDLEGAAARYASLLPDRLDLVHLGLGDDGHTASLVPDDPVLDVRDRTVATTRAYRGHRRMTLTYPALAQARRVLWLVGGAAKAPMLPRLLARDPSIPAGRVTTTDQLVLADAAAAAGLGRA